MVFLCAGGGVNLKPGIEVAVGEGIGQGSGWSMSNLMIMVTTLMIITTNSKRAGCRFFMID